MKKYVSIPILILLLFIGSGNCLAQDEQKKDCKISFDVGADLVSRYIWRGAQYGGSSPNIQPNIALNLGNFQIGNWSSYSLGGNNFVQEFDFYAGYTFLDDMFTVMVTDYYFPDDTVDYNFYNYKKTQTGHVLEGLVSFNGTEKVPLSVMLAVNFYGGDAIRLYDDPSDTTTFNTRKGIQYSTYAEIGYSFIVKTINVDAFMGFNLTKPKAENTSTGFEGESGYYGDKIGIINIGLTASRGIPITKHYELPISVSLITNPESKKFYAVFAINF